MAKTLAQKILEITKEMGTLEKKGRNTFHKYNYITEADAMEAVREGCIKHGVLILPDFSDIQAQAAGMTTIQGKFRIVNAEKPEEFYEIGVVSQGFDKGDKGCFKAITGGYKYLILKLFQVVSGDPAHHMDPENPRYEPNKPSATKKEVGKEQVKTEAQKLAEDEIPF